MASLVESETYLYYIHTRPSRPSAGEWVPYDPQGPLEDFKRLWGTGFLDNLWVEVKDVPSRHVRSRFRLRPAASRPRRPRIPNEPRRPVDAGHPVLVRIWKRVTTAPAAFLEMVHLRRQTGV